MNDEYRFGIIGLMYCFMISVIMALLIAGLALYIVSPIDALPGPVDDAILGLAGVGGVKLLGTTKKLMKK